MAETYSNTTTKSHGMKEPSYDKQKLKYAQDWDKGMHALDHTAYNKKQKSAEHRDDRIVNSQKKHY